MTGISPKTKVSTFFHLGRDQTTLDFVDVPIGNDTPVFLDPSRLRSMQSIWASECNSLLQHYFETLLAHVKTSSKISGIKMLEALSEKNEFHLGFSSGVSSGNGFGHGYAEIVWSALTKSKASTTGLLKDIEDTCLFIEGIGPDRISDAVCNIIRAPLIKYTQDMCQYYDIPLTNDIYSGPIWDPQSGNWHDELIPLPTTPFGKLLLVPKSAVRHRLVYDASTYYNHHLLPAMQASEKEMNSSLVHTLKDGRLRVTKKSLKEKYGADKLAIVDQTLRHPDVLNKYRDSTKRLSQPITHNQLAEIENIPLPNFNDLLTAVNSLKPGKDDATNYENAVEKLLSALFFPSLSSPQKQHEIHNGRKRIDITYVNNPMDGFFHWLSRHFSSSHIFVECKNYGKEIGNPEFDQLAGRFSPSRGQVGLLICRSVENSEKVMSSCIDTAKDNRGWIIVLTDDDLKQLVDDYISSGGKSDYQLLMTKFEKLIM
jgi:hypothetical protein